MDMSGVFLVNVAKGRLGEDSALLLGGLIVSTLGLAAFSRADAAPDNRRPFFIYLDEFCFTDSRCSRNMMSELRKYGVWRLSLAHQHFHQPDPDIRHAVLGTPERWSRFEWVPKMHLCLAQEFQPKFGVQDSLNLANHDSYLKLMIDGTPSQPFSATTLPV